MSDKTPFRFQNRFHAGNQLAQTLLAYIKPNALVLALPRGGVPVAFAIAQNLNIPLDLLLVRKLGCPGHEEVALGAIASGGIQVLNPDIAWQISKDTLNAIVEHEKTELRRRECLYRGNRPPLQLSGKQVILVDDGLATGATMRAAIAVAQQGNPSEIMVAIPVAPFQTIEELQPYVAKIICLVTPPFFRSVGEWYEDFSQTSDTEVMALLEQACCTKPDMP